MVKVEADTSDKEAQPQRGTSRELLSEPPHSTTLAPETVEQLIRPLARRAMFMRPIRLCQSAWLEHIPFAFWLVEAHQPRVIVELGTDRGASYFAFCQAVDQLGLDTSCFAVDTWKGDEHAGFYGEEVFDSVRAHNDAHYSRFSRLVRSTFDEAAEHFSDGTIDLLHIDGLHLLDAVRHDFESWLPKLSDRAVVLLHDSNVRERQFGVYKLVEELREIYPSFEFIHGHGLAVFGVGPRQTELVSRLFETGKEALASRTLHDVFGRLGRACADAHAAEHRQIQAHELRAEVARKDREVSRVREMLEAARGELDKRSKEINDMRVKLQDESERRTWERAQLLEQEKTERKMESELAQLQRETIGLQSDLKTRDAEIAKLADFLRKAEEALDLARKEAATERVEREKAEKAEKAIEGELAQLRREAEEALATACQRFSYMLGKTIKAAGGYTAEAFSKQWALQRLAKRLRKAGVVDAEWYLARNDDVAKAGIDPVVHYILHGIVEGRAPFDLKSFAKIGR